MEKVRDNWGKNYKTQKSIEQDKINATSSKYNSDIQAKEQQLQNIASTLNQKTGESLKTEGFSGLYIQLAKYINDSKFETYESKPTTSDDVSFWLNFCISVCLEFFGIGFIYLSMREDSHVTHYNSLQGGHSHNIGFKPSFSANDNNVIQSFRDTNIGYANYTPYRDNHLPNNAIYPELQSIPNKNSISDTGKTRQIGFVFEKPNFPETLKTLSATEPYKCQDTTNTDTSNQFVKDKTATDFYNDINVDDLKKYLEYMFASEKYKTLKESPGYTPIGRETFIGIETARKIKGFLEHLGIVESVGTKTFVRKDKPEAMKSCKLA
jgi:hypothetical protein